MDQNDVEFEGEDDIPDELQLNINSTEEDLRRENGRLKKIVQVAAEQMGAQSPPVIQLRPPSVIRERPERPSPPTMLQTVPAPARVPPTQVKAAAQARKVLTVAERVTQFQTPDRGPVVNKMAQLSGDRQTLIAGYKDVSICHTLANNAIARAQIAASMLDAKHRDIILSELNKAKLKNGNAKSRGIREIPLKRAVAIALKAEQWVYQAQAAAAKFANKEAKACRRKLSGRHHMTKKEKEARYLNVYGVDRGTKAERTEVRRQRNKMKRDAISAAKRGEAVNAARAQP